MKEILEGLCEEQYAVKRVREGDKKEVWYYRTPPARRPASPAPHLNGHLNGAQVIPIGRGREREPEPPPAPDLDLSGDGDDAVDLS